jgi:diacylglycerol kinase (ATP)
MRERSTVESFNSAIEGFFYVIKTQKNMRLHFLAAVAILLFAIYLNIPMHQILILCSTISLVLLMEMVNTAVELTVDMVMETFHPLARIVKDVTAGAVLLSAVNAFVVGYLIFQKRLGLDLDVGIWKVRQSPWHLTFIATILVMALVMLFKVSFHKGKPLRGGMPSGHAAFVFSVWAIMVFLSGNSLIVILTFLMAVLVARSRIANRIHSVWEVLAGAALGILVTTLVFQLLQR